MVISDPTKPWAIVLCKLQGSNPPDRIRNDLQALLTRGGKSLADFWQDATLQTVDTSGSRVFPENTGWYDCGWTVLAPAGPTTYPGIAGNADRATVLRPRAHELWVADPKAEAGKPVDESRYRGILAVFNFACGAGRTGADVVYGMATGSSLTWAEDGWYRCANCYGLIRADSATRPCWAGATHAPERDQEWQVPTDPALLSTLGGFAECTRCGLLHDSAVSAGCPAGGSHDPADVRYYLMSGWAGNIEGPILSPNANFLWHRCATCGMVAFNDGKQQVCPATGKPHALSTGGTNDLSITSKTITYSRTWLAHEMGHAYGFVHSRDTSPQSTDIGNDGTPGAYRDSFDIMSAMACDFYFPDASEAPYAEAGPLLSTHQLVAVSPDERAAGQLISEDAVHRVPDTADYDAAILRTADSPASAGAAALTVGLFTAELRMVTSADSRPGWDRALRLGGAPAAVVVHDHSPPTPVRVESTIQRPFLLAGDTFEQRLTNPLGHRERVVSIHVAAIDPQTRTARVVVERSLLLVNSWQRWAVLPCRYADVVSVPQTAGGQLASLFAGVEQFFADVSAGAANIRGTWVLNAQANLGDSWFTVGAAAADAGASPQVRITTSIDAVLANPTPQGQGPIALDWRYFTGLIIVRNTPGGAGYLGRLRLRGGNMPDQVPPAGEREYDIVELGSDQLDGATVTTCIADSLGLTSTSGDRFHLMTDAPDAYRYSAPDDSGAIHKSWGPCGPSLSVDQLAELGWLSGMDFAAAIPPGQRDSAGSVFLKPVLDRHAGGRFARLRREPTRTLRARFGEWTAECRTRRSWDSALPYDAFVLAWRAGEPPEVLHAGDARSWGGPIAAIVGGGSFTVREISPEGALVEYAMHAGERLVAGGGTLHGGGTVLFTPGGGIVRIPPGDPVESAVEAVVDGVLAPAARRVLRGEAT